jgi:hypothetical protein
VPQVSILRPGIPKTNSRWKHPPSSLSLGAKPWDQPELSINRPFPPATVLFLQQPSFPPATVLSFQQSSPFCHPERTRISCITALISDHECGSLRGEPHEAYRSRNSQQEIRGRRGICGAPFVCPAFTGPQPPTISTGKPRDLRSPFLNGYVIEIDRRQGRTGDDDPERHALNEGTDADLLQSLLR